DLGDLPTCTVAHPCVLRAQSPVVTSSNDRVPNSCQRPVVEFHLTTRAQRTVKNQIGAGTVVECGDGLIGLRDQQRYESRRGLFTPGCISSVRHRVFVTVVDAVMIEIGVDDVCATVPKIKGCGLFPLIGEAVNIDQFGCVVTVTGQQCERSACVYGLHLRLAATEDYLCARHFEKSCDTIK